MAEAEASTTPADAASDPDSPTGKLSTWLAEAELSTIPAAVRERAKHILLDGIGCLLVGSHIDWSALGVDAITGFDEGGSNMIVGWGEKRTNAYSAAMLNSSFIQAFELDDYYPAAPLHSNSILIPAMLPIIEKRPGISGADVLLALILGYETGTRVGLALHGPQMLSRGWHSGVVFGGAAAAASAGKLLGLSAAGFEDAIGMASTQACGLMSAQFESMIKRMQHGFAARNGLYAAVLARGGYIGIKRVFEREYGGFLAVFGEGHDPDASQITAGLGSRWITTEIAIKPYSAMAALHGAIDCCLKIREDGVGADQVKTILVEVGDAAFQHGGFEIKRPIQPITAQMSLRYSVAVALLDGAALLPQFSNSRINQDDVWLLLDRVEVRHEASFDKPPHSTYTTRVTVTGMDGAEHEVMREAPHGGEDDLLTNAEIVEKFETLTAGLLEAERSQRIRDVVLGLEGEKSLGALLHLLKGPVKNALT